MNTPDQDIVLTAIEDARRVLGEHIALGSRDATRTVHRLIAVLDRDDRSQRSSLGQAQAEERPMTVWIYVNTSKQVGDAEHVKVFANADAAETWFEVERPRGRCL
jgi:hypothetical protein